MLDLIIIIFIGISIIAASRKGFIKTAYQLGATIISVGLSLWMYPIVTKILKFTPLYEQIRTWNIEKLSGMQVVGGLQAQNNAIRDTISWLPDFMVDNIVQHNNPEIYGLMKVDTLVEYIGTYIADICISAIAIIGIWVIVRIVLSMTVGTLDILAKLPILNSANKLAGGILGGIKSVCFIWLIYVIVPFLILLPKLSFIEQLLAQSMLARWLYENNLILQYFNQIFF